MKATFRLSKFQAGFMAKLSRAIGFLSAILGNNKPDSRLNCHVQLVFCRPSWEIKLLWTGLIVKLVQICFNDFEFFSHQPMVERSFYCLHKSKQGKTGGSPGQVTSASAFSGPNHNKILFFFSILNNRSLKIALQQQLFKNRSLNV